MACIRERRNVFHAVCIILEKFDTYFHFCKFCWSFFVLCTSTSLVLEKDARGELLHIVLHSSFQMFFILNMLFTFTYIKFNYMLSHKSEADGGCDWFLLQIHSFCSCPHITRYRPCTRLMYFFYVEPIDVERQG
jgi:hypothetical protein